MTGHAICTNNNAEVLPDRDIHPKETIHRNSCKAQNWNDGQQNDHTADKETGFEWSLHSSIHQNSQRYCHKANQKISHGQRDNKTEGRQPNAFTGPQGQNNQHVTQTATNCNDHFHKCINHLFLHCAFRLGVWSTAALSVFESLWYYLSHIFFFKTFEEVLTLFFPACFDYTFLFWWHTISESFLYDLHVFPTARLYLTLNAFLAQWESEQKL